MGKRKAMKTVEEMRVAVLAECDTVCPNRDFPAKADWGHLMFGYVTYDGDDYEAWFLYVSASIHPISLYARSADQIWIAAYRLLGLSERDAVETERTEMMKTVDALSAMVTVDPVAFAELEAKNAALVAALQTLKKAVGYKPKRRDEIISYRNDIGIFIDDALAANEKGGAND